MLSASTNFKNYIQENGREIALRISWDAIVLQSEDVMSCVKWFDGALYTSVMQGIELEVEGEYNVKGKSLLVEFGVSYNGSAIEWLTWGTFLVKNHSIIAESKSTKIEAFDAMLKSHIAYDLTPTYPITVGNYLQAICTRLGITLATPTFTNSTVSIPDEKYAMLDNIIFRDVLHELAEVAGGIIHIRADGQMAVKYPTATSQSLNSNVKTLDVEKLFGEVNTLVLATTPAEDNTLREDLVSVASFGRHEVRFEDNQIMVLTPGSYIDNLFNRIKYTKYYPFELDSFGYGYFEVGDIINAVDENDVSYQTIVLGGSITIDGGFTEMMYAKVPEMATTPDYDNAHRVLGPRETAIILNRQARKINLFAGEITLIASDVGGIDTRLSSAETKITPTAITNTVRTSTEYTTDQSAKENTVFKQTSAPSHLNGRMWLDTSVTPNIWYRSNGSSWIKATPTQASEVGAYTTGQVDTKLVDYSTIIQTASQIALEVGTVKGGQDSIVPYIQGSWEQGAFDLVGIASADTTYIRTKYYNPILSSTDYILELSSLLSNTNSLIYFYNATNTFISYVNFDSTGKKITTPATAKSFKIRLRKTDGTTFSLSEMPNHFVRVVPVGKYLKGSKFEINGEKIISTADGIEFRNASGTPMIYFDTVSGKYKFDGEVVATSGKIGRFDISGDDLVYTSDLFNKEYDWGDYSKLQRILAGLDTPTAYESEVYDVNSTGTLTITDLVIIRDYVENGTALPTPRRQIRSVIRIGTTSGELKTTAVSALGNTGSTFVMKADKITGDLLNVKGLSAKGGTVDLLDVINGVRFPATFVGSNEANVLDDYEEGIWTPVLIGNTTAGVGTYTSQVAKYTKIGRMVHFIIQMTWTAHTGTGTMRINNLPFVCANDINTPVTVVSSNMTYAGQLAGIILPDTSIIALFSMASNAGLASLAMDTSATLYISGSYMV